MLKCAHHRHRFSVRVMDGRCACLCTTHIFVSVCVSGNYDCIAYNIDLSLNHRDSFQFVSHCSLFVNRFSSVGPMNSRPFFVHGQNHMYADTFNTLTCVYCLVCVRMKTYLPRRRRFIPSHMTASKLLILYNLIWLMPCGCCCGDSYYYFIYICSVFFFLSLTLFL